MKFPIKNELNRMQQLRYTQFSFGMRWTNVVKILILANVTIFAAQELLHIGPILSWTFGLVPAEFFGGKLWQIFTYMFLHGGLGHIFFNMLVLWMFGSAIESVWGSREFLKFYLICGLGGGLSYALFNIGSTIPTIGASGAIYGLLAAYAVMYPDNVIYLWMVIPIRAKWFALIMGVLEFYFSLRGGGGIAHLAHLGGMIIGYLYLKRERMFPALFGSGTYSERRERREQIRRWKEAQELDQVRREVDDLLDKINREGMDSLSRAEQKRLEKASQILREKENRP
ncbi:MAG: rhomboid family intramembrane serine protease [Calditrichota bacterium]